MNSGDHRQFRGSRLFRHPVFDTGGPSRSTVPLSMIDVVFLLLTFLLLGQFPIAEGLLSMEMAGAGASVAAPPQRTLWIRVEPGPNGQIVYRLNDWPATESLPQLLAGISDVARVTGPDELAVVIGVKGDVPFEELVALWDSCRKLGIDRLALPAREDTANPK